MKAMLLISALFSASLANANVVNFACRGILKTGDKVTVSGQYEENGGDYQMLSNLSVSGTDGAGVSLFSSGGGSGGTERFFLRRSVTISSDGNLFTLTAISDNRSRVQITHDEGSPGDDTILVRLKETDTLPKYEHEFEHAKCRFK